jgi:transposase
MAKLGKAHLMTIEILHSTGETVLQIAKRLGVDESTVRYHLTRMSVGATDGRTKASRIEEMGLADAVRFWWAAQQEILPKNRSPNAEELHAWLQEDHGYTASAKSVRKWVRQHLERPRLRPYRRVETPPGAQAQVDWSEHPGIDLGDGQGERKLWVFHMVLSHCRQQVDIACLGSDQLWWHQAHLEAFRRLGGVPAVVRIDNCKTGMSHGAGVWGTVNPAYQNFARSLGFHVDPCPVRHPEAKGKVERGVRTFRGQELARIAPLGLSALQGWFDQQTMVRSQRRRCAATGSTVAEAFAAEGPLLRRLPDPCPEPFDIAVTRVVAMDCTVAFEGRRYGVPFAHVDLPVEVRGCAGTVQVIDPVTTRVLKVWPRHTRELLLIDADCYAGDSTDRVQRPTPMGALGERLVALGADGVQRRAIDIYAAVADLMEARR